MNCILYVMMFWNTGDKYHDSTHRQPLRSQRFVPNEEEAQSEYWMKKAQEVVTKHATRDDQRGRKGAAARNIVLFLGDGMSVPTLTAARTLLGQRNGHTGEEAELYFETFPTSGLAKVINKDQSWYYLISSQQFFPWFYLEIFSFEDLAINLPFSASSYFELPNCNSAHYRRTV